MATIKLTKWERNRLKLPNNISLIGNKVESLPAFLEVISSTITMSDGFWFRGQKDTTWSLTPSALRYDTKIDRKNALSLIGEFKRIAELKLDRPPDLNDNLKWIQLAQHYGIPTRLLDWTESALFALYFACLSTNKHEPETDGIVYLFNSIELSLDKNGKLIQIDNDMVNKYLKLGPSESKSITAQKTIAIKPVWNSNRIMMQRGVFTLHGKRFTLDNKQVSSLVGIPILKENKGIIKKQLDNIGIDEITLFPELEYISKKLKRNYNL